jgi:hypothetical protein
MSARRPLAIITAILCVCCICGCSMSGIDLVSRKDAAKYPVIAVFESADSSFTCSLVSTPKGQAILGWSKDWKEGELTYYLWQDERGRHFVCWGEALGGDAIARDYILDPNEQKVDFCTYPAGRYNIVKSQGVTKLMTYGNSYIVPCFRRNSGK